MTCARLGRHLALIFLLSVAALGCSKKKTFSASPKTVSGRNFKLTIESVQESRDRVSFAAPGNMVLGIEMVFEGTTAEEVMLSYNELRISDRQGHSFRTYIGGGPQPSLSALAYAKQGISYRGFVSFEVPKDASELTLHAQPVLKNFRSTQEMFDDKVKVELR